MSQVAGPGKLRCALHSLQAVPPSPPEEESEAHKGRVTLSRPHSQWACGCMTLEPCFVPIVGCTLNNNVKVPITEMASVSHCFLFWKSQLKPAKWKVQALFLPKLHRLSQVW